MQKKIPIRVSVHACKRKQKKKGRSEAKKQQSKTHTHITVQYSTVTYHQAIENFDERFVGGDVMDVVPHVDELGVQLGGKQTSEYFAVAFHSVEKAQRAEGEGLYHLRLGQMQLAALLIEQHLSQQIYATLRSKETKAKRHRTHEIEQKKKISLSTLFIEKQNTRTKTKTKKKASSAAIIIIFGPPNDYLTSD